MTGGSTEAIWRVACHDVVSFGVALFVIRLVFAALVSCFRGCRRLMLQPLRVIVQVFGYRTRRRKEFWGEPTGQMRRSVLDVWPLDDDRDPKARSTSMFGGGRCLAAAAATFVPAKLHMIRRHRRVCMMWRRPLVLQSRIFC